MNSDIAAGDNCKEISDLNLCYMLLAQKLLRQDRVTAILRLGISEELADMLVGMSMSETVQLATSNFVLCGFRLDESRVVRMLRTEKNSALQHAHMAIVLSGARTQRVGLAA